MSLDEAYIFEFRLNYSAVVGLKRRFGPGLDAVLMTVTAKLSIRWDFPVKNTGSGCRSSPEDLSQPRIELCLLYLYYLSYRKVPSNSEFLYLCTPSCLGRPSGP